MEILKKDTLRLRKIGEHVRKEGIVLRKIEEEFVTHRFDTDIKGEQHYYWGHYFKDYKDALIDYIERKV